MAVLPLTLLVATARADSTTDYRQGTSLFAQGMFTEAIAPLDRAARADELSLKMRAEALQALGVIHVALGDEFESRRSFARLLAIVPDTILPDTLPPKVHRIFQDVRRLMLGVTGIGLKHRGVQAILGADATAVAVEIDAANAEEMDARLHLRRRGEDTFQELKFAPGGRLREMPLDLSRGAFGTVVAGDTFEYFIETLNRSGETVGRVGGPRTPLMFEVVSPNASDIPLWKRGWFWTGVGVVVAAAATGAVLAARAAQSPDSPCVGALDCVQAP